MSVYDLLIKLRMELKNLKGTGNIRINHLPKMIYKMLETKEVNILHLSDLHFGIENTMIIPQAELDKRDTTLKKLTENLKQISEEYKEWKPDIIAITGDIGYAGKKEDYALAKKWVSKLLSELNLENKNLIICPGNHDRNIEDIMNNSKYPKDIKDSDMKWHKFESEDFEKRFGEFIAFTKDFLIPLKLKGRESYLSGYREIEGIKFIVLNSARYAYGGDDDKGKLYLGWPDVNNLFGDNILTDPKKYDKSTITISLFHHPDSWFHDSVTNEYGDHAATYNFLAERCHIMLSGHLHAGKLGPEKKIGSGARHFSVGAAYLRQEYANNCAILKLDLNRRILKRLPINFNSSKIEWVPDFNGLEEYDLRKEQVQSIITQVKPNQIKPLKLEEIIKKKIIKDFIDWKEEKVKELMVSKLKDNKSKQCYDYLFSCIIPMSYSEDLIDFLPKSTEEFITEKTKLGPTMFFKNPDYYSKIEQYFRDLNPIKKSQTYPNPDFLRQYNTMGSEILIHKSGIVYICFQYGLLELGQFNFNPNPLFGKGYTVYDIKKHQETYGIPVSDYSPQNIAHFIKLLLFPFIPDCKIKLVAIPTNEFLGYFIFPLMKINDKNRKLYEELPFSPKEYTGTQKDVLIENQFKYDIICDMVQDVKKRILAYFRNKADTGYI